MKLLNVTSTTTRVFCAAALTLSSSSVLMAQSSFAAVLSRSTPHWITTATSPTQHSRDILRFTNAGLAGCELSTITVDAADPVTKDYDFSVRAHYSDGSWTVNPVRFTSNLDSLPSGSAERLLNEYVPWVYFLGCAPIRDGGAAAAQRHVERTLPALNERLMHCTIRQEGRASAPDGEGNYVARIFAHYDDGTDSGRRAFETNLNNELDEELHYFLSIIPSSAFPGCAHREDTPDTQAVRDHVVDVLEATNAALDHCTLVQQGDVTNVDVTGGADFDLMSRNDDGTTDVAQRFHTNVNTAVDAERDALLAQIPAHSFPKCRHADQPDAVALRAHAQLIVDKVNTALVDCTLAIDGALGPIGNDGWVDYYINAAYPDSTHDTRKLFRTNLGTVVDTQASEILEQVPTQIFRRCRVRDEQDPDDPVAVAALQHVVDVTNALNDHLNGCVITRLGPIGPVDSHGDFDYYLQAYVRATGQFTPARRFPTNMFNSVDNDVSTLLNLIPRVEFHECPHRG